MVAAVWRMLDGGTINIHWLHKHPGTPTCLPWQEDGDSDFSKNLAKEDAIFEASESDCNWCIGGCRCTRRLMPVQSADLVKEEAVESAVESDAQAENITKTKFQSLDKEISELSSDKGTTGLELSSTSSWEQPLHSSSSSRPQRKDASTTTRTRTAKMVLPTRTVKMVWRCPGFPCLHCRRRTHK